MHLFCDNFLIKFWSDELLNMLNKKRRHVWTRRGVHLDSTHEKEKCCILPKNMNLCVLLLLPTSFCATFILLTTTTNTSSLLLLSSPPSFVSLLFIGYLLKYAQLIINKDTQWKSACSEYFYTILICLKFCMSTMNSFNQFWWYKYFIAVLF